METATSGGKALVEGVSSKSEAVRLFLSRRRHGEAYASLVQQSGHSPSGNFIHLEQVGEGERAGWVIPSDLG